MVIELSDKVEPYSSCICCKNTAGLKTLRIGKQIVQEIVLCQLCRTALVGQLIEVR